MIEVVCDGMNATKSYTRGAEDVKAAVQILQRHFKNDPDNWVVIRDDASSLMIMQEGGTKFGMYNPATGECVATGEDLTKIVPLVYTVLTKGVK